MRNFFASFLATIIIQAANIVVGVLTARLLLPEGKGELVAIFLWPTMLVYLGNIGLYDSLTYFSARENEKSSRVLLCGLIIASVLALILVVIGYFVLNFVWNDHTDNLLGSARLYLLYIPINLFALVIMSVLLGKMYFVEYNILRSFVSISFFLGILFLIVLNQISVRNFVIASLVANLGTLVFAIYYLIRYRLFSLCCSSCIDTIKDIIDFGLKVHLGNISSMANLRLDQLLMTIILSNYDLGLYTAAVNVANIVPLPVNTIAIVAYPQLAKIESQISKAEILGRFIRISLFVLLFTAFILFILTPWGIQFFFGNGYFPATSIARILILAAISQGMIVIMTVGVKAINQPLIASQAEIIGLLVTIPSLWILLPRFGIVGAAFASLMSYYSVMIVLAIGLSMKTNINIVNVIIPRKDDFYFLLDKFKTVVLTGK